MQDQVEVEAEVEGDARGGEEGEGREEGGEEGGADAGGAPPASEPLKSQDPGEKRAGCSHYKRRAKFVTPCCNKFYMCRYCHDDNESHYFNRKSVTELICTECDTRQKVQAECEKCGVRFGNYTCLICNLFDDEDKKQYHCDGCGICRVGGREKFFHCAVCNMCLPVQLKTDGHKCVENVSRSNCPVCLEDIHTSRIPCHIPDCGHLLHRTCFEELLKSGHYACPTCQTSMIDMSSLWQYLDSEVALTPMPPEYSEYKATILCKDCHKLSTVNFHVVGLKCSHCGAYNTCQTNGFHKGMEVPVETTTEEDGSSSPAQASSSDSAGSTSSAGQSTSAASGSSNKACNCRTRQNSNPSESTLSNVQLNESSEKNDSVEEEDQSHTMDDDLPQPNISDEPPQA